MCMEVLICSLDPGFVWFVLACKNLDFDYKKKPYAFLSARKCKRYQAEIEEAWWRGQARAKDKPITGES